MTGVPADRAQVHGRSTGPAHSNALTRAHVCVPRA
jgi:hypothetical protein